LTKDYQESVNPLTTCLCAFVAKCCCQRKYPDVYHVNINDVTFACMNRGLGRMANKLDIHIFQRIKDGDVSAFNDLFDTYYSPMCLFARKVSDRYGSVTIVVQQVFVDLWVARGKLSVDYSLKSYLFHSVKNRAIDHLRKQKNNIEITETIEKNAQVSFRDVMEESELSNRITKAISQLPEKCREIFLLCRFDGLKYIEIAEKLGISVKTVEMQMGIALKKLRKSLSDYQMIQLMVIFSSNLRDSDHPSYRLPKTLCPGS
jgi:RNA polymerase sigma-70 factor, ECF subfamily